MKDKFLIVERYGFSEFCFGVLYVSVFRQKKGSATPLEIAKSKNFKERFLFLFPLHALQDR